MPPTVEIIVVFAVEFVVGVAIVVGFVPLLFIGVGAAALLLLEDFPVVEIYDFYEE